MTERPHLPPNPAVIASRLANARHNLDLRNRLLAAERMEPKDWQEAHSGTEAYMVRRDAETEVELTRRRKVDQRLWDGMSAEQEQAAMDIQAAFTMIVGGMAVSTSRYAEQTSPGRKSETESERAIRLQSTYWHWSEECVRQHIACAAALDVLCFGMSCGDVDRERRKRKTWARRHLYAALDVYVQISGRMQRPS